MAHPYAKHHQDKVSRERAKHLLKGYDSGGRTMEPEGVEGARVPKGGTANVPPGPIERLGAATYRREVGRGSGGQFGKYPHEYPETWGSNLPRKKGGRT